MRQNVKIKTVVLSAVLGISTLISAMEETMDIRSISPIKNGMSVEQKRDAVECFLKENLPSEFELKQEDIIRNQTRICGRSFNTYTFEDGSEWVIGDKGIERFLGYLYLKKAIEHYNLEIVCVTDTRFFKKSKEVSITTKPATKSPLKNISTIISDNFFSLSRYMGDSRLSMELEGVNAELARKELGILRYKIGFTDMDGYCNLRLKDGKIYVIDTEYSSFSSDNLEVCEYNGSDSFVFSNLFDSNK